MASDYERERIQWVSNALKHARSALTGLHDPSKEYLMPKILSPQYASPLFWSSLPDVPVEYSYKNKGVEKNALSFSFFNEFSTREEKKLFLLNQISALSDTHDDILAIDKNPIVKIRSIEAHRLLADPAKELKTQSTPNVLLKYIQAHTDIFDANPALHFVTRAYELCKTLCIEKETVKGFRDLAPFFTDLLYKKYDIDLRPGQVIQYMANYMDDKQRTELEDIFAERKPSKQKSLSPVSEAFQKSRKPEPEEWVQNLRDQWKHRKEELRGPKKP